ncbi:hypothetical protein M501DRAFT_939684 [Patellaria atrata CBS 101060]|uniref:SMP-30/Gluconolactonase/LRE-like region domain-containing protein n=1 Tax=Patellaria atrata CBS 101060 TaxID=1346257 RepID=A0A9P4S796_9PEZI|nr:hypothetical protein M501DRAFT_939684 [Patellaria atrata CBS 101060]
MRFSSALTAIVSLTAPLVSAAVIQRQAAPVTVYKFSSGAVWAEGLAARSNGQLIVSFFDKAELWTLDPSTKKATKLASIAGSTCTGAITEISPDVFAGVVGQFSFAGGNKPGSWSVWKADFTGATPQVSILKAIPEAGMLNGITTLGNDTLLVADALKGSVYRLSVSTGAYSVAIQDATMTPPAGGAMGIDGIRYANGFIYYTNVFKNTFHKAAVDMTGKLMGAISTIWSNNSSDDLAIGSDGAAYVAAAGKNQIVKVTADNKVSTVASAQSPTTVVFGRGATDMNTLYIATSSGSILSVPVTM